MACNMQENLQSSNVNDPQQIEVIPFQFREQFLFDVQINKALPVWALVYSDSE